MRVSLETEALYAADFPFVDYGCDLHIMAEMEKVLNFKSFSELKPTQSKLPIIWKRLRITFKICAQKNSLRFQKHSQERVKEAPS